MHSLQPRHWMKRTIHPLYLKLHICIEKVLLQALTRTRSSPQIHVRRLCTS